MNEVKKSPKKRALGRGLDAILPEAPGSRASPGRDIVLVPISHLSQNPHQARQHFPKESLEELAVSIKKNGVLQPVIARPQAGGRYEIVAGERRWRAAQMAGVTEIPVIVKQVGQKQAAEINLVENIQREDLNPMEEAEASRRLIEEHGYTQEELAGRIGRSRVSVTNLLRLLELPVPVQEMIRGGTLTEGHGRALLRLGSVKEISRIAREIVQKGLSVRETERMAARISRTAPGTGRKTRTATPEIRDLCNRLQRRLGTRVDVKHSRKGRGRLEIHYKNLDELDRILAVIFRK